MSVSQPQPPRGQEDRGVAVAEAVQFYRDLGLTPIPVCKPVGSGCNTHRDCKSPGKVPVMQNWQKAYRSEKADARIVELFQEKDWDLNVGLLCGKAHNLYVVDVDGEEGNYSLACENGLGEMPDTLVVTTGRVGGYHMWYRPIESDPPMHKKIGFLKHVDFVAEGGFVLAPPSIHKSGTEYRFAPGSDPRLDTEEPITTMEEWTRDLIEHSGSHSNVIMLPLSDDSKVRLGQATLTFLESGAISAQRDTAFKSLVNLLGRGIDRDEAIERVTHALVDLSPQTDPRWPWKREDVEKMVDSIEKQGGPKPPAALSPVGEVLLGEGVTEDTPKGPTAHASRVRDIYDSLNEDGEVEEALLEGLVFPNKCHNVFAAAGTGKTLWTLEMMLHIAAGREYHDRKVKRSKVLLVEVDDTYQLRGYMEAMRDAYGFTREELGGYFITNKEDDSDFSVETEKSRIALQAFVSHHEPEIVVVDHFEGFLPKVDGYGATKYHQFRQFKDWCKARGITLWVVDHALKGWMPPEEGMVNHLEALAGGGQKMAIFDVAYHMYGNLEDGPITIWYAKLRDLKPDPFKWGFGGAGSTIKTVISDPYKGLTPKEVQVVSYISNHGPVTTKQVLETCGLSKATWHRLLQARFLPRELVERLEPGGQGRSYESLYGPGRFFTKPQPPTLTL